MSNRHRLTAGRHLSAGQLVRLSQNMYIPLNPCLNGNCNENECEYDDPTCCEPLSAHSTETYGVTHSPNERNFYQASDLFAQENGGISFSGMLGFGGINLLVPSHTQLFSENRSNLNDSAQETHSATYNISSNLGFARYRKNYAANDPMKSLSYSSLKKVVPLTPRMSLGESSLSIDSVSSKQSSGGIDFQKNRVSGEPAIVSKLTRVTDPREVAKYNNKKRSPLEDQNLNPDGLSVNTGYAFIPYSDIKTHVTTRITPRGEFKRYLSLPKGGYNTEVNVGSEVPVVTENSIVDITSVPFNAGNVYYLDKESTDADVIKTLETTKTTITTEKDGKTVITVFDTTTTKDTTTRTTDSVETISSSGKITRDTSYFGDESVDSGTPAIPLTDETGNPSECPPGDAFCQNCDSYCERLNGGGQVPCVCSNCDCSDDPEPCNECENCANQVPCFCGDVICSYVCPEDGCPPCESCNNQPLCPGFGSEISCPECGGFYCFGQDPNEICDFNFGCGCGNGSPISCGSCPDVCPELGEECLAPDCLGECGGEGCDGEISCCPPDGSPSCVPCDPCPDATTIELNASGDITSVKGNFTNRDLIPVGYFSHDLNVGGGEIESTDVVLSANLVLTVQEVYGRLPFVGAKPYAKPLKLDLYEVLQDVDPNGVSCSQYSAGKSWTSASGRNTTDRSAEPVSSITIDTSVKPGDRINFDLTSLARKVVTGGGVNGKMVFMIEASEWFAGSTGDTVASDAREKVAMLVSFHQSGRYQPKINTNIMRKNSTATSRLAPGVARRRLIGS